MRIQDIIKKITSADDVANITFLVSRIEGMLPSVETARTVAGKLGIAWDREPTSSTLAWAWTVWPAVEQGRLGDLEAAVVPLLPAGQPFGESEIDAVCGDLLLAEVSGDAVAAEDVRKKARGMRAHNEQMN